MNVQKPQIVNLEGSSDVGTDRPGLLTTVKHLKTTLSICNHQFKTVPGQDKPTWRCCHRDLTRPPLRNAPEGDGAFSLRITINRAMG